jgi:amino acid adenylation domain-containing protein
VAYVVTANKPEPSVSELRQFLQGKLPDYMIPSWFLFLDAIPLTSNGKLDRNALPPPDGERPALDHGFVEPRTEIEELVAQVWREVLKRDRIGVYDNFFDLGGHSLLATRVVARLRANFDIDLPLRKLFELPTVASLTIYIDVLRRSDQGFSVPTIVPVSRDRSFPLSFAQQRLWFLRELDPASTAYNMPSLFSVKGPLNVHALEQAINSVVARHEILRSVFRDNDGIPVLVIRPSLEIRAIVVDLTGVHESVRQARAHELVVAEARTPFDLRTGPLLRVIVFTLSRQEEYYLLLNIDHIVFDGGSMARLFKEIAIHYEAFAQGRICYLDPLAIQYADYAVWQREAIPDGALCAQLEYWSRQLSGWHSELELPADHSRPALQTWSGARLVKLLPPELTAELKILSQRKGVTVFMTLLAAFDIIISRWTGSEDVIAGATLAGRNRPEVEELIGFFINALPLRVNLAGNPTFVELLMRIRDVCLDAYTYQDLPFDKIVEAVNPQRDPSRNPLFQYLFNLVDTSGRELALHGCEVRRHSLFDPEAKFDLTLYAPEKDGHVELALVYNVDLFNRERIGAMLDQFVHLLMQIAKDPENPIEEYDLSPLPANSALPNPQAPLDNQWVGAIHELFSAQAESNPDQLALCDPFGNWTYAELERAANQLANWLIGLGLQPKDVVAVYADRRASLVIALLGILKAGGVFTILDGTYPAARLESYLRSAMPKILLQMAGAGQIPEEISSQFSAIGIHCTLALPAKGEEIVEALQRYSQDKPPILIGAHDPAYIAFTSGSTGEPKGVLGRHGPVTHFLPWQAKAFGLTETDRFALLSGLAYNHLHRDVFTPLALGASLYVPPVEIEREPIGLRKWLGENAITVVHLTPALGHLLLTGGAQPSLALRRIFFGGDVLTQEDVVKIREFAPNATIGCFYGATETQRAVGYHEITGEFATDARDANRPIPLGRGIEDVQLLVLKKNGQMAGICELGEIYVRSPHLAEGYVGDGKLTSERFLKNPFRNDLEDRLYRTGELGRYRPDGNVEWAGRNDRRVNIRGFRVELEEIESTLKQHPIVKDAAVVAQSFDLFRSDNPKSQIQNPKSEIRLVAYIVSTEENTHSLIDLLHSYVCTRLPDYMVPAHLVFLEQLPLNPNGKTDYVALPAVQRFPLSAEPGPSESPRNDVERKLCAIFCQVLDRENIGVNENFFRLGGHSLLAAQAAARVRDLYGFNFELRTFLSSPTVAGLAKHIALRIEATDTTPRTDDHDREEFEL